MSFEDDDNEPFWSPASLEPDDVDLDDIDDLDLNY